MARKENDKYSAFAVAATYRKKARQLAGDQGKIAQKIAEKDFHFHGIPSREEKQMRSLAWKFNEQRKRRIGR